MCVYVHVHMCKKGFLFVRSVYVFVCVHVHVCKRGFLSQLGKRLLAPLPTLTLLCEPSQFTQGCFSPGVAAPACLGCPWPGVRVVVE